MDVLLAGCEALFNVSSILLTAEDRYNFEDGWDLEVEVP
jgi:hypothetical protein